MDNFLVKVNKLQQAIHEITDDIANHIEKKAIEKIDELLLERHSFIADLIALHITDFGKTELRQFLNLIRERDKIIMANLFEQQSEMKSAIAATNKITDYLKS